MNKFTFNISLSVLNHLGRHLYRSFITVLGEAISNSWDAEADNVWIYLDREENFLVIKDDGNGMSENDFQSKFLKIGYSKRKDGENKTPNKNRPYIGRKGIGKLALLSCAERISVISKTNDTKFIGGIIDNTGLDQAIEHDLTPQEYPLETLDYNIFNKYSKNLDKGTIIYFDQIQDGIKNTEEYLKKVIALYFRFSLLDDKFNIFFNDEQITIDSLDSLADSTQFLWKINISNDPFVLNNLLSNQHLKNSKTIDSSIIKSGFIGSVSKPRNLKILTVEEKVGIDLFVNGRLREKDLLKHIPSARIAENYLYGQIHCDFLDDEIDRFTSSREGIVSDDTLFQKILTELKSIIAGIIDDWDKWRIDLRQDGDSENPRMSDKERTSRALFRTITDDFVPPKDSENYDKVEDWIKKLANDAQFNFSSYAECFISENLIRSYIEDQKITLSPEAQEEIKKWKRGETDSKNKGNISIDIRKNINDLSYLSMNDLSYLVDMKDKGNPTKSANLSRDADEYKPIRDALAHTALLTDLAKLRLTSIYENIKARIKSILNE
ncbi:MAG: DNA mismatch repair protein [Bacteroidetes bacterium]|nr:DNA mismatch repair protein [Bacteroidota bacterium]